MSKVFDLQRMRLNGDPHEYKDSVYGVTSIDVCGFWKIILEERKTVLKKPEMKSILVIKYNKCISHKSDLKYFAHNDFSCVSQMVRISRLIC